jgi:predicted MFS family arabinose efflux permease
MPDKRLLRILPCSFAVALAIGIVNLGTLFLVKSDYGTDPLAVGWLMALWSAAYFVGCLAFRPLSRRIDASCSAVLMCFLSASLLLALIAIPSFSAVFVAFSLYGFVSALFWPRIMGWLAFGLEGSTLSRASGSYSLSWSLGMTLSPFIAGALSERSRSLPLYVGVALFFASCLFMLFTRRLSPAPSPRLPSPALGVANVASSPLRYPAWIGLFAIYALYSVLNNIFPLYAKDELGLSESSIGLFLLIRAAALAAGFYIFGRLRFWHFKPAYLPASLAAALALCLAFIFVRGPLGFALGLILLGSLQSFMYSLSVFYGASGAADRDKMMSVHEAVLTAGMVAGSVGGGAAYQGISWPMVFVLVGALVLLCLPAQMALSRKR